VADCLFNGFLFLHSLSDLTSDASLLFNLSCFLLLGKALSVFLLLLKNLGLWSCLLCDCSCQGLDLSLGSYSYLLSQCWVSVDLSIGSLCLLSGGLSGSHDLLLRLDNCLLHGLLHYDLLRWHGSLLGCLCLFILDLLLLLLGQVLLLDGVLSGLILSVAITECLLDVGIILLLD